MLELYQFPSNNTYPNMSPFCLKLETYLKLRNINYQTVELSDPRKAPLKKLPFIKDNGKTIPDSELIIKHLEAQQTDPMGSELNPEQQAIALGFRRLLEEDLYMVIVFSRWLDEATWPTLRKQFFGEIPPIMRTMVSTLVRKQVRRDLIGHGLGRHSKPAIYQKGADDLQALSDFLGDKPWFMGSKASLLDASAFGVLSNIIDAQFDTPLKMAALNHTNLGEYTQRVRSELY